MSNLLVDTVAACTKNLSDINLKVKFFERFVNAITRGGSRRGFSN